MTIPNQGFTPATGWNDTVAFPTNPSDAQVRPMFQLLFDQLTAYINTVLIPSLTGTTAGSSGSENIGSAIIAGIAGSTVFAQISNLLALEQADKAYLLSQMAGIVLGVISDSSLTNAKLGTDIKVGSLALLNTVTKVDVVSAVNEHLADYVRQPGYGITAGSANTYTLTLTPAPTSYKDGMGIAINMNVTNTGASTINVNGLGAKALKDPNGNDFASGTLKINTIYSFKYSLALGNFILQGKGGGGNATAAQLAAGATATVDSGPIVGTAQIFTLSAGDTIVFRDQTVYSNNNLSPATKYSAINGYTMKRFTVNQTGSIRVKVSMYATGSTGYVQVYKSGVAVGTLYSATGGSGTLYSQDFTCSAGDYFEVMGYASTTSQWWEINDFQICCTQQTIGTFA